MSERDPSQSPAPKPVPSWTIAAIAVGLGFVMLVILHGIPVTSQTMATWIVASAAGIGAFLIVGALRRRRGK